MIAVPSILEFGNVTRRFGSLAAVDHVRIPEDPLYADTVDPLVTRRHFHALAAGGVAALWFGGCMRGIRGAEAQGVPDVSGLRPARRGAGGTFRGQRHQGRMHAGNGAHGIFGALSHRLPHLHGGGIDRHREEHLAVADHDLGQHAGVRQGRAAGRGHLRQRAQNLLLGHRHNRTSLLPSCAVTIGMAAERSMQG